MAFGWCSGLETGNLVADSIHTTPQTGSVAIESSIVRSGGFSVKATPASGATGYWIRDTGASGGYLRFYVRFTSLVATTTRTFFGQAAGTVVGLKIKSDGAVEFYRGVTLIGTSTVKLTDTAKWYCIEVRGASAVLNDVMLRIDGSNQVLATGTLAASSILPAFGSTDTVADTFTAYYDDICYNTTQFPGPGKVELLLPASDNTINGWTGGNGGTTSVFDGCNNTPPAGVASANETDLTNIESGANSATDNCDLNAETYAAKGINSYDTVNGVHTIIRHGEDIATGTKAGAVSVLSNPNQGGETTFNYGNDSGAHGIEVGNWETAFGAAIDAPTVDVTVAPVLRAGKRTATNRTVCVDLLGLYVDYTPGTPPAIPVNFRKVRTNVLLRR